jgi:hypothetical protein
MTLQVIVISELLRRFGVSGRKRSYQTLLVAARSSRRPFSFTGWFLDSVVPPCLAATFAGRTCLVDEQPRLGREFAQRCFGIRRQTPRKAKKKVGAARFQTAPPIGIPKFLVSGSPGVRMGFQSELLEKR